MKARPPAQARLDRPERAAPTGQDCRPPRLAVPAGNCQFIQAANVFYPPNPDWVEFEQPQAHALFSAIAHDAMLPGAAGSRSGRTKATPAPSGSATAGAATPAPSATAGTATPAPRASASASARPPVSNLAQTYGGITGNASCGSDSSAFAGPLTPGG